MTTTNRRNAKATLTEPQTETMPEAVTPTADPFNALPDDFHLHGSDPLPTELKQPEAATTTFPSLSELQALPIVDDLANDWLLNNLQLAVALRVRQMLNSPDPAEQYRVRTLLETMTFTLAAGALHNGLQHAITASKESLQTVPATADA